MIFVLQSKSKSEALGGRAPSTPTLHCGVVVNVPGAMSDRLLPQFDHDGRRSLESLAPTARPNPGTPFAGWRYAAG